MSRARIPSSRRFALAMAIVGGASLAGCAANLASTPRFATSSGAVGDIDVPVASLEERRFLTVVRQRYDFSCGSAALATLLKYHYDEPRTEEEVFRGMWAEGDRAQIRRVGFSLLDMKRYLAGRGLRADGFKVSLDQVAKAGVPGVALVTISGYRHFVVVKGVGDGSVLVGDPALGLRTLSTKEFTRAWNGVYFVLNDRLVDGRAAFNGPVQWASLARGPLRGRFVEPVSLQALALTAPFYRDF